MFYHKENEFFYTFTTDIATEYLIRAESLDGKESWFYLATIEKDSYNSAIQVLKDKIK